MSPLVETILSIIIVVIVLIAVCWVFGCFKKKGNQESQEPTPQEPAPQEPTLQEPESSQPPLVEATELPKLNYAPQIPSKTVNGREYKYQITSHWYKHTDGEYYQVIKSNTGGSFFVTKDGKRYYVTHKSVDKFFVFPEK